MFRVQIGRWAFIRAWAFIRDFTVILLVLTWCSDGLHYDNMSMQCTAIFTSVVGVGERIIILASSTF